MKKSNLAINNPYHRPFVEVVEQLKDIKWASPYVPQVVQLLVFGFILIVLGLLYVTMGIITQITFLLRVHIRDTYKLMKDSDDDMEKFAYIAMIGIYLIFMLPFSVLQTPFWLIGTMGKHHNVVATAIAITILVLGSGLLIFQFFNHTGLFAYLQETQEICSSSSKKGYEKLDGIEIILPPCKAEMPVSPSITPVPTNQSSRLINVEILG